MVKRPWLHMLKSFCYGCRKTPLADWLSELASVRSSGFDNLSTHADWLAGRKAIVDARLQLAAFSLNIYDKKQNNLYLRF